MTRIASVLLLGVILGAPGIAPESSPKKELFCPECWKFLSEPGDLDSQGRCLRTRRTPVPVEAVTVNWFWCKRHEIWHRRPCGMDASDPTGSVALLVPAGSEPVTTHAYCPEHRMFSDLGFPGLNCPACGKPLVAAETVERRWFWCRTEEAWQTKPCPSNDYLNCCILRSGMILAYSWQIPFLGSVAFGPSENRRIVEPEWLASHRDDPHLVVLHVGYDPTDASLAGRSTYFDGHIPGARSVEWNEIAVTRDGIPNELPPAEKLVQLVRSLGIDEQDRLVLYDTGCGIEAARAYLTLDYLGLGENAALLNGQWARWKALKLPDSRMPEDVEPSAFVPKLRPEIFLSLQAMKDLAWLAGEAPSSVALLDAREPEEFFGFRSGKGILVPGHIEGAANLCWFQLLQPVEEPILWPEEELRAIFESAGARPGRMIVAYCRTGTEASLVYFAAKVLGYDVRFYDGSYFEWSREAASCMPGPWAGR